jgi:hypothetical protein
MCTFMSLRLLMCMVEASRHRMTQYLRHNLEAGSSLHIKYIGLSLAYKRAFRALRMLISNFPLFAFGAAAEGRRGGGAEEQGPAEGQVGTGEDQVSIANLFTL